MCTREKDIVTTLAFSEHLDLSHCAAALVSGMAQNSQSFTSWFNGIKADDIDGGLAADFDGSLSGLGVELGSSTYNMR